MEETPAVQEAKPLAKAAKRMKKKAAAVAPPPATPRKVNTQPARDAQLVSVVLTMPHFVNGQPYGPGEVKVPRHMVPSLLDTEQRVRDNDHNLMGKKAAFIGPGGRAMPVRYEMFDSPMLQVLEAMTVS